MHSATSEFSISEKMLTCSPTHRNSLSPSMHEFASPPHPPEPADTKSLSDATVTSIASDGDCSPRKMSVGSVSMPKAGLKDESLSFLRLLLAHIG